MIYLDSSAVLKLLFDERESTALEAWLTAHAALPMVSSELAKVEVLRACRGMNRAALPDARVLLDQLDLVVLDGEVVRRAAELEDPLLRSPDALHLASAVTLGPALEVFVAYDQRLLVAAGAAGLDTEQPGA